MPADHAAEPAQLAARQQQAGRVSVVIPTYRRAASIEGTVRAVLEQRPPPFEIIVIDDGSPDQTPEILAPFAADGRIRYERQANAGQGAARNRGAALAMGEYLLFLDDDDLLAPGSVERHRRLLDEHADVVLAFGSPVKFDSDATDVACLAHLRPLSPATGALSEVPWTDFLGGNKMWSPGQGLIRRSAFEQVGGFRTTFWGTDDWDLWLKIGQRGRLLRSAAVSLYYRQHPAQMSQDMLRMTENCLGVVQQHLREVPRAEFARERAHAYACFRDLRQDALDHLLRQALRHRATSRVVRVAALYTRVVGGHLLARVILKLSLLRRGRWRLHDVERPA